MASTPNPGSSDVTVLPSGIPGRVIKTFGGCAAIECCQPHSGSSSGGSGGGGPPIDGCSCPCCPDGIWTEYTFTISGLEPILGPVDCDGYNGTWVLKYRGTRLRGGVPVCVWSTDEVVDGSLCEGDVSLHPFDDPPERWLLYCLDGIWTLVNAGTTVAWNCGSVDPCTDFCIDGGDMLYVFEDTSACCKWNGFAVYPTETHYLTVSTSGVFIPC